MPKLADPAKIATSLTRLAVPVDSLVTLVGNPRRGDVEAVKRSYEKFGQLKPVVVRSDTREVVAGNHQLAAARELGWLTIAATIEDMDDDTARAYALADNRTGDLGGYDDTALLEMLQAVAAADDASLLLASGFDRDDIADLMISVEIATPAGDGRVDPTGHDIVHEGGDRTYLDGQRIPTPDSYAAAATRIMVLSYDLSTFVYVQDHLGILQERLGTQSNSETVLRLIRDALEA